MVAGEAGGFKKVLSGPFVLEVSRDVRVDLKLQPGAITETVQVSAEGALADTTDTTLNGVLSNKAVSELPVQGRDFQNLLELHPGVQRTPGGGFQSITSNGNRADDNNFFIDGADDNDAYYGENVASEAGISGNACQFLAARLDSGVQHAGKSLGGLRREAGRSDEHWDQVGDEQHPRLGVLLQPQRRV
jgi:hypothetical protein